MLEFAANGKPLGDTGLNQAVATLGSGVAELWSVIAVECSGSGYLPDRRPKILFERHIFSRLTGRKFDADDPDVSQPTAGGYGQAGAHQYDRLAVAMTLDREAAMMSASWGLGQILGTNYKSAGFDTVQKMVDAMVADEDGQLQAMVSFLVSTKISQPLLAHDWAGFARRYNGPNYAAHNYDGQLHSYYDRFSTSKPPDLRVRAVQTYLRYNGYPVVVDGVAGQNTKAAIAKYRAAHGLPPGEMIDDQLVNALTGP